MLKFLKRPILKHKPGILTCPSQVSCVLIRLLGGVDSDLELYTFGFKFHQLLKNLSSLRIMRGH